MIEINRNPSRRDLLIFASILPLFFGVVGALFWRDGSTRIGAAIWIVGAVTSVTALAGAPARRRLYLGWMYASYPIAWVASRVILAAIYFVVATPIALWLRAIGRDPMLRSFDKAADSYWVQRTPNRDRRRYFRQF